MGNLNELCGYIRRAGKEQEMKNKDITENYYSVKYNYDKLNKVIELSNISSIEMNSSHVENITFLTLANDFYTMSVDEFLNLTVEEDLCMAFPQGGDRSNTKYISFFTDAELFDKYLSLSNIPNEGYFLLKHTVNKNYSVHYLNQACLKLQKIFLDNGYNKEAKQISEQIVDYIIEVDAKGLSKVKQKYKEKRKRK